MIEKVALGKDFLLVVRFPPVNYNLTNVPFYNLSSGSGIVGLLKSQSQGTQSHSTQRIKGGLPLHDRQFRLMTRR